MVVGGLGHEGSPLVAAAAGGAGGGAAAGVVACGACHLKGASAGEGAAACAVGAAGMGGRGMEGSKGAEAWEWPWSVTMLEVLSAPRGHRVCIESFTSLNKNNWLHRVVDIKFGCRHLATFGCTGCSAAPCWESLCSTQIVTVATCCG